MEGGSKEQLMSNFISVAEFQAAGSPINQSLSALSNNEEFIVGEDWRSRSSRLQQDYSMRGSMAGEEADLAYASIDDTVVEKSSGQVFSGDFDLAYPKFNQEYWDTIKRLQIQLFTLLLCMLCISVTSFVARASTRTARS